MDREKDKNPSAKAGEQKRKGRRAYLEDIRRSPDGKYVYTGAQYTYDKLNPRTLVLIRLWALALPAAVACIASGCLSTPFTRDVWYVIGPLAFELASLGSVVWAVCRITGNGDTLREYVRKQTFGSLPLRCGFTIAFAAIGLVGAAVYMIFFGSAQDGITAADIAYLALKAVNIACCSIILPYSKHVRWQKTG